LSVVSPFRIPYYNQSALPISAGTISLDSEKLHTMEFQATEFPFRREVQV